MKHHYYFCKKFAFTLAEVLITLGIIGIVAALTMPTLIAKHQKQQTVVQLKKAVSVIEQALVRAQADHGDVTNWILPPTGLNEAGDYQVEFINTYLFPYMKIVKDCGVNNANKCEEHVMTSLDKNTFTLSMHDGSSFITTDGTVYNIKFHYGYHNGSYITYIDLNGTKGPNICGRDIFVMVIENTGKISMFGEGLDKDILKDNSMWGCNSKTSRRFYCGALIQQDGWQISDDYLWQ